MGGTRIAAGLLVLAHALCAAPAEESTTGAAWLSNCQRGDAFFRRAQIREAEAAYRAAIETDPANARAWWGLGRIASLEFRRTEARDLFAKAFRLDPRNPEIILSYAGFAADSARAVLLGNIAAVAQDARLAESVVAQRRLEAQASGRLNRVASAYAPYRIKLGGYHPAGSNPAGLTVPVRLNGGKLLRLVLDTGARGIVVHARAGRGLDLDRVGAAQLGGFGGAASANAQLALAGSVHFGDLELRDCPVELAAAEIAPGADGVIGAALFQDFQIRIDPVARTLDLLPYAPGRETGIPVLAVRDLLLVRARVNRDREGLFLLDTGAAYTSVARGICRHGNLESSMVPVRGAQGLVPRAVRTAPIELDVAGQTLVDSSAIALDLDAVSEAEGIEISGVIGYSLLGKAPFTLNYRDGVVRLEK